LIWELEKIRYQDWSAVQQQSHNSREKIVDRDNHAFDSSKYFFTRFFFGPERPVADPYAKLKETDPRAYEYWKRVAETYYQPKHDSMLGGD
jgi:hypothetical protein